MPIPLHGVKLYAQCYTKGKVYAHSYAWIKALCSMLFIELNYLHVVIINAHCYTWCEV